MSEAAHDPIARRFVPDPRLVHQAHNLLLAEEKDRPGKRFIRQQWDTAFGATRVAMDALREVWPMEARQAGEPAQKFLSVALDALEEAYHALDSVAEEMVGELMVGIQTGQIRTQEEFDAAVDGGDPRD